MTKGGRKRYEQEPAKIPRYPGNAHRSYRLGICSHRISRRAADAPGRQAHRAYHGLFHRGGLPAYPEREKICAAAGAVRPAVLGTFRVF